MASIAEAVEAARLPHDVNLPRSATHTARNGEQITVRCLNVAGMLGLIQAFDKADFGDLPSGVPLARFLTPEQAAELDAMPEGSRAKRLAEIVEALAPEQKRLLASARNRHVEDMVRWARNCPPLMHALIRGTTGLTAEQFEQLDAEDGVVVLNLSVDLTDWGTVLEGLGRFFVRSGDLVRQTRITYGAAKVANAVRAG